MNSRLIVLTLMLFVIGMCSTALAVPVTLDWTAPGDDGNVGTATEYDFRYAADSSTLQAWGSATQISGEPVPQVAGSAETFTVDLPSGVWFVAVKTRDEAFNWSELSNIHRVEIDTIAPAAILNLRVR